MKKLLSYLSLVVAAVCFSACHFGRSAEEILNEYNNVERDLLFTLSASGPDGSSSTSRTTMVDNQVYGVESRWKLGDALAIFDFGQVFYDGHDASKGSPLVPCLEFDKNDDNNVADDVDDAVFKGTIHAKMGEKALNKKSFAMVQPYRRMLAYYSDEDKVELDFTGQDGTLSRLADWYQYTWALTTGVCEDGEVTFTDAIQNCNVNWHDHSSGDRVAMDNKMAIIRFSVLFQPTDKDGVKNGKLRSLNEYLADSLLAISYIEVENMDESAGFTKANLNLSSGKVSAHQTAESTIRLESPDGFLQVVDIPESDAIIGAGDVKCWGTTFYMAVPCPENGTLPLHPMVKIHTCDALTHVASSKVFYGTLSTHIIKEANYYMSSPIITVDDKVHMESSAKLFVYYHSSFVWAPTSIE